MSPRTYSVLWLAALTLSFGACTRQGCARVPPDPEPAECKPGQDCPVEYDGPKPIGQPRP